MNDKQASFVDSIARTVTIELQGLEELAREINQAPLAQRLEAAVRLLLNCRGRVVFTGMGKSGHVARKIAATMASTGTPATYLHPGKASHGDLGVVAQDDVLVALSWSGETKELLDVLQYCGRFSIPVIAICSVEDSALSRSATVALTLPKVVEACPHQLAPTTSTTVQMALGDALAIALLHARGFTASDFKVFHPGGKLGAQLRLVKDLMGKGEQIPTVPTTATVLDATVEMSSKRYGSTAVVDEAGRLRGVFTDGDLRRAVQKVPLSSPVDRLMTTNPHTVSPDILAAEAIGIMNQKNITTLYVLSGDELVGVLHLHDLLRAGVA